MAAIAPPRAPARASKRAWGSEDAPRILLLTSGLGCGHVRAAEAVEHALLRLAPRATVRQLDFWTLMNPGVAAAIQKKYLELVLENTDLYARLHGLDERTWRRVIENDIPPPAEVIELIELVTRNDDPERRSTSSLFEWALGPYPTDLLFYPDRLRGDADEFDANARATTSRCCGSRCSSGRSCACRDAWSSACVEFAPDAIVATQMVPGSARLGAQEVLASLAPRAARRRADRLRCARLLGAAGHRSVLRAA